MRFSAGSIAVEVRRHSPAAPWTYATLDARQREIAEGLWTGASDARGALLLSEVAPVITCGRRTPGADLLFSREVLQEKGIGLCPVDRGGFATYHGPGQWVLFAVDRLETLTGDRRGVRRAVEALLSIALEVGRHYDSGAEIRSGAETGVWTPRGKFAAVGVHIERGVLLHGLAVNAYRTPESFQGLRPCGLEPNIDFLFDPLSAGAGVAEVAGRERESRFVDLGKSLEKAAFRHFWRSETAEKTSIELRG